jgi:O-acetylhomoserine/O-acetylserine sulfhydrylase-like pyridoxal-dependent enzyme
MEHRSLSLQTLAAQALGETDPATGALAPVITMSTNYEQRPDGSYPQGRAYTRADNPTSEHAERLLAALEGGECAPPCPLSPRSGWPGPTRRRSHRRPGISAAQPSGSWTPR